MTTHTGSCHCGAVRYEVDADISTPNVCNCSMCQRAGTMLVFVPEASFRLLEGADATRDYQFAKQHIHHLFCPTCGIKPYAWGLDQSGARTIAVNVRCIEGVDLSTLTPNHYDGAAL